MPVYHRYAEDLTGENPDNRVTGELCSLSNRPVRVAVPKYGPFFTEKNFSVYDNLTQRLLVKGVDYRCPMIVREATLRTGLEVADALLIENPDVSSQISITYQCIGAEYQNNVDNIVAIYESFLNDGRTVDWVDGIYGKPTEFPPAVHPHWVSDLYGFEPLTVEMERIAQAIMLGNTPAFEMLLQAMESKGASDEEMDLGKPLNKFVTLKGLLGVLNKYNFNSMVMTPGTLRLKNGQDLWVSVKASFVPDSIQYFWSIEHESTSPEDFALQTGYVNLVNGSGQFLIQSNMDVAEEDDEYFRIAIRRKSGTGQIVALSERMTLLSHTKPAPSTIMAALSASCPKSPTIQNTAKTAQITRNYRNASFS